MKGSKLIIIIGQNPIKKISMAQPWAKILVKVANTEKSPWSSDPM